MSGILKSFLMLTICLAGASWVQAQDDPLQFFSKDVDVLIRLKEPDQTMEKVVGLVNRVQPGAGDQIRNQQNELLGKLISNPTLTGVDQSRDWYAGVYFQGMAPPQVVFAIPAVKPEDLVSAVQDGMKSQVHDRWVLYTDADEIPVADRAASAATRLGETGIASFSSGDLNIYVNVAHVTMVYAEQIELAQDKVLEGLNQLRFLPAQGGINMQAVVELYGTMAEGFFQALEDGQTSMASVSLTDTDIVFHKQVTFADESASSRFLAQNPPDAMPLLTKLPSGAMVYYGFSGAVKEMTRMGLKMTTSMISDKAALEKIEQHEHDLDAVTFGPVVAAVNVVDDPAGVLRASSVFAAEPIDKVREFTRALVQATSNIHNETFSQTSTLQTDAETYGEFKADIVTTKQEFKEEVDPSGLQQKMQQFMFGADGLQARTIYMKGQYATTLGGGEKSMQALLQGLESSNSNSIAKYREAAMKEANLLVFLDLSGFVGNILRAASRIENFPLPINGQMIDALNLKSSYISMAGGSEPNIIKTEIRLPVDQIIGMTKLGVLIGSGMRNGL